MKHLLIEYTANDMLPGDWAWYLATYQVDKASGARDWLSSGRLEAAIYEFPKRFRSHSLVPIQYTPSVALGYGEKAVKAPRGVRWGILLAVHDSLIKDIGEDEFAANAVPGPIKTREGIVPDWRAVVVRQSLPTPIGTDDSPKALAGRLGNSRIAEADRYSLILREDLAWKLSPARFPGCRLHWVGA